MRTTTAALLASATLFAGCHASLQAKVDTSKTPSSDMDRQWEEAQGESWSAEPGTKKARANTLATDPTAPSQSPDFIGATPDLSLAPAATRAATCACVAVVVGAPSDPAFAWRGAVPTAGDTALALAITGEGVACEPPAKRGKHGKPGAMPTPSLAGVEREGEDVIVTLEAAHPGRPLVHGALIPKPGPKGAIVVRGRGAVPFGRAAAGGKVCRVAVASAPAPAPTP